MTRVAHLLLGAADQVAGIQKYIASLQGSYAVVVINRAPHYEAYLRRQKIPYVVYQNMWQLLRILRAYKINVLHCHLGQAARIGFLLSFFLPLRLVYTQHFIEPAYTRTKTKYFSRLLFRLVFFRFFRIVAISQAVAAAIFARGEVSLKKVTIVHNGIAPTKKRATGKSKTIVMVCRMQKEKRPELILTLARLLPKYSFVVLGAGALLADLSAQAPHNCRFLGYREQVDRYLVQARYLFMPAPREPFGYVYLEALRLGVPVLAQRGGAAEEILTADCAYFFNEKTLPRLAEKIRKQTERHWRTMSRAAASQAEKFSLQRMRRQLGEVYRQC